MVVHNAPTYMTMVHNIGCRSGVGYGVCLAYRKPHFKVCIASPKKENYAPQSHIREPQMYDYGGSRGSENEKLSYMLMLVSCHVLVLGYA